MASNETDNTDDQTPAGRIESLDALRDAVLAVAQRAERHLCLLSDALEPAVYATPDLEDCVRALALRHRRVEIRVLVRHPTAVMAGGDHRLVTLARRLPSRIAIRAATQPMRSESMEWVIADSAHALIRPDTDQPASSLRLDDGGTARRLRAEFNRHWDHGEQAPSLRQLSI